MKQPLLLSKVLEDESICRDVPEVQPNKKSSSRPIPLPVDRVRRYNLLRAEYQASTPSHQFEYLTQKWSIRSEHQYDTVMHGRRPSFPHDQCCPYGNAQNFIRRSWIAQKIWQPSWGPAWPSDVYVSGIDRLHPGPKNVGLTWTREKTIQGESSALKEPGVAIGVHQNHHKDVSEDLEFDYQATRPLFQFLAQLRLERRWLQDELNFTGEEPTLDLDTLAYQSTKQSWVDQGIWTSTWNVVPDFDDDWLHERMSWATYQRQRVDQDNKEDSDTEEEFTGWEDGQRINERFQPIDGSGMPIVRCSSLKEAIEQDRLRRERYARMLRRKKEKMERMKLEKLHANEVRNGLIPTVPELDPDSPLRDPTPPPTQHVRRRGRPRKASNNEEIAEDTKDSNVADSLPRKSPRVTKRVFPEQEATAGDVARAPPSKKVRRAPTAVPQPQSSTPEKASRSQPKARRGRRRK